MYKYIMEGWRRNIHSDSLETGNWNIDVCRNYWGFGLCPSSGILKNIAFWKPIVFPSSGEDVGDTYSVESVRKSRAWSLDNLCQCNYSYIYTWDQDLSPVHLRAETDPVSEVLCSLVYFRIPDDRKELKNNNSNFYTPSSEEPFII
jgi:hypothetical protein